MRRPRFTLVEMIAVMATLMILASMLLPAIQNARVAAFQVQCHGNLRQLALAMLAYGDDWRGRLPAYDSKALAAEHVGVNWPLWSRPYYQDIGVLVCPASPNDAPQDTPESLHRYDGHYAWNYDGMQGNRGALAVHVRQPSDSYLLMDSGDPCIIYGKNTWANLMEELDLDFDSHAEGCNRHRGQVDIAFVDGHAAARELLPFLAAPCDSFAAPWCMAWDENDGVLQPGPIPVPDRR